MEATFQIIGVYQIRPTTESILEAARYHGYDWLINEEGSFEDEIYWDNFQNLALVEVQINGKFSLDDWFNISQNDQAPYMEFYLDEAGTRLLSEKEAVETGIGRACFFLHFVDTTRPLKVGEDEPSLPPMSELPERLMPFTHYVPVD